ncbi:MULTISPECIES: hypothetical protein [Pseudomonadota]|uniref:hypothetical protein n=1 Tax=Pseudomonadota TaxID=1224 RepID=UPI000FD958DA|nr:MULTISPECIES: hypothetical protein [Pseudomonadota]MDT0137677.1 hypothetical protein [Acidovorax sp. PRC11]
MTTTNNTVPGGWTPFHFDLTPEAKKVFEATAGKLIGVKYTALAFATQVVNGTNYSFLAKGQPVAPQAAQRVVKIHAHQPPSGDPHLDQIITVTP